MKYKIPIQGWNKREREREREREEFFLQKSRKNLEETRQVLAGREKYNLRNMMQAE